MNNMIELNMTLEVALKSGAKVLLSEAQTRSVMSYIETIITGEAKKDLLPAVSELVPTKRKYRRRGTHRSFTPEEDARLLSIMRTFPVTGKGRASNKARARAITNLGKELNRTDASMLSRIWKIRHTPGYELTPTGFAPNMAPIGSPISVTLS